MTERTKNILFICGSRNQTTQMHQISEFLPEYRRFFTPYYADGIVEFARKARLVERTILGHPHRQRALHYFEERGLAVDLGGKARAYDLAVSCADLIVQKNIRQTPTVLVQEGMTDPEGFLYHVVKALPFLPRWLCSTASFGLSDAYVALCVASEGYRDLFIRKGVKPEKIFVTGIPNFDHCRRFLKNDFPHHHYVLACTSDSRETLDPENRKDFIRKVLAIADGRKVIFKLHPNENVRRASREIQRYAPEALIYSSGSAEEMVANCDALVTRYSSTAYVGLALGKEVFSAFNIDDLKRQLPLQNGMAARLIADVCRQIIAQPTEQRPPLHPWHVRMFTRRHHRAVPFSAAAGPQ